MAIEWIIFEIFINFIEVGTVFYLLCKKFSAKYNTFIPTFLFIIISVIYLSIPLFVTEYLPPVEIVIYAFYLFYVIIIRTGNIWKKIFWVSLACALLMIIASLTITMFSLLTGVSNLEIITQYSNIRLLTIITGKIIHIVTFYILSLKNKRTELVYNQSLIICFVVPFISFLSAVIMYYISLQDIARIIPENLIYVISISYLIINIMTFVLYEIINKEAEKNYILTAKYTQYEITEHHNSEIVKIYSNMKEWRHDYYNHMQLIVALLEKSNTNDPNINEATNYLKNLDEKIKSSSTIVSTGNYIVDAIVSAKLALSSSFNIKFEYNISLPENLIITDTDLCAVLSNLLDNSIEACCKLENSRYINLEIIIIKNQLHLKLLNSTDGKYKKENGKFKTTKNGQWHGIGMKHIESIIEKYNGTYNITADNNSFITQISLPLSKSDSI